MISKLTDFKLAEAVIKKLCRQNKVSFVDVSLSFDKKCDFNDNYIFIGETKNIAHTLYQIISTYIKYSYLIVGKDFFINSKEKDNFLINLATALRKFIYGNRKCFNYSIGELTLQSLYQRNLIWIMMKDLICPAFDLNLDNVKIITGKNSYVDISRYYEKDELNNPKITFPFIFVNEIDNRVVQNAFLLVETIKALKGSSIEIIKTIFETDLYDKFEGLLTLSFDDEDEINEFILVLTYILDINLKSFISKKSGNLNKINKLAQVYAPELGGQWWYLGVIEKLLDPTRGSDWTVYDELSPYVKQFWGEVEELKKERAKEGKDPGVPFSELLALKSTQTTGYKVDPTLPLETLLGSDRIW